MAGTNRARQIQEQRHREMVYREREADRLIAARFRESCMSDAKWNRFFDALGVFADSQIRWKFVNSDRIYISRAVYTEGDHFEADFGSGLFRHVEWIEVVTPDPSALIEELDRCGRFGVEPTGDGLRVYGYR